MNIFKKKSKGFTLIELLAILILLGILLLIAVPLITNMVKEAKSKICSLDAKTMALAADNYVSRESISIKLGESRVITLNEIQEAGYISEMFSPYAKKTACTGYVVVTNEGKNGNDYYTFESELKCGDSCTTSNYDVGNDDPSSPNTNQDALKDDMKEKNNDWYFEGSNPNNWVKFGMVDGVTNRGLLWRIVKIDNTGIKMVYEGLENGEAYPLEDGRALIDGTMGVSWNTAGTNKWNEPVSLEGKLSTWLSKLNIPNISNYLAKINWKVGGVPYNAPTTISTFTDYQAINSTNTGGTFSGLSTNKSYVGTINAIDFMYTSDNENCSKSYLETGSTNECAYNIDSSLNNFLQKEKYLYWTLNARSDVSNMAWDISNSGLIGSNAVSLSTLSVRPVLNLKLDINILSGTGTMEDPYLLEESMVGLTDKPVITIIGNSPTYIRQYDTYEDLGASATDKQDGDLTSNITTTGTVNINVPGQYEIKYNVVDSDKNAAMTVTRKVIVIERDRPIITLNGSDPTNVTITKSYVEPGATAYDINYGDISSSIVVSGSVDTSTLGTYYIKYNVTNIDGLSAPEVERKVIVGVPVPKIELNGSTPTLIDIGTSYIEEGATAIDEVDGDLTSSIIKKLEYYNPSTKKWQTATAVNANSIGKYRMKYSITNSYGSNAYVYREIQVVKVDGPIIKYTPNGGTTSKKTYQTTINVSKNIYDIDSSSLKYLIKNNWNYTNVNDETNYKTAYVDNQVISLLNGTGYYTIYARAKDTFGNLTVKGTSTFRLDNSKPDIYINSGTSRVLLGGTYVDTGATAYDYYYDKNITKNIITTSNVDTSKLGVYYVTYTVTDSAGNTTTKSRKVTVYHPEPKIFLNGGSSMDLLYGTPYVEKGARAYDEIDGDLTSQIIVSGSVDSNKEGTYIINYKVTNSSGFSKTRPRTVNVYIPYPTVVPNGSSSIKLLIHSTYVDQGATATDQLDGDLTSRIITTGYVNPDVPGTYKMTYQVTNNLGKVKTATRNITVYQPTPDIQLIGSDNIEIIKTSTYIDQGATASDEIDGNITSKIITTSNVNTSKAGTYRVTYNVTNSEGISYSKTRTVIVREPKIEIIPKGSMTINLPIGQSYVDQGAIASDELLGDITSKITSTNNINPYVLGTYYVYYSVTSSGVTKTTKRTVKVVPLPGPIITLSVNGNGTYKKQHQTVATISKGDYDVDTTTIKYLWKDSSSQPNETDFRTSYTSGSTISTPAGATGKYYLFILAKDIYGNISILNSNAFYLDNTRPVITLVGSKVIQTPVDGTYVEQGVTVVEQDSGLDSNGVVVTSTILSGIIGTYNVKYTATDKAGNQAIEVTRTVSVIESSLKDAPKADFVSLYDASYFVGSNPNNWVEFGNAASNNYDYIPIMWRIIKADNDGVKIIYEGVKNTAETGTNENGTIGTANWDTLNNTWNRPATIRTMINNFYTNLNEPNKDTLTSKINWCVGLINSPYSFDEFKNASCSILSDSTSAIGLVNAKDYILTSKDACSGYNEASCGTNNFLKKNYSYYTLNGDSLSNVAIFVVNSNGGLTRDEVTKNMNVRPVINLRSDVLILGGEGTFANPYKLNTRTPIIDNTAPSITFTPKTVVGQLASGEVEVLVTDDISGVDNTTLKYLWSLSSTQPSISTITNSFTNGDKLIAPTTSGNYYLWVVASDNKGNQAVTKGGVYSIDNNKPVITLKGTGTVNVPIDSTYTDAGVTALDNIDGDITSKVTVSSNINIAIPGTYYVKYNVSDAAGNKADELIRTVVVYETTPPTVTFNPNSNSTYTAKTNVSVSVTDNMDLDAASLKYQWTTSLATPTAASFTTSFSNYATISTPNGVSGTYYLWIYAKDKTGNEAIVSSSAYYTDSISPVITMNGNQFIYIAQYGTYTDTGAIATDNRDGTITGNIVTTSNLNPSVLGSYSIVYTVTDAVGNTTSATRTVVVASGSTLGLLPAIGSTDYPDGDLTITVNGVSYDVEFINVTDDTTYTVNTSLGNTTADARMLIVKYHGNLTVNSGVTITAATRKKGMLIYVAGVLTNNGTITMTARGAKAAGQNVYLLRNNDGSYETIPAAGAAGAASFRGVTGFSSTQTQGKPGFAGSLRGTGGGGTGGAVAGGYAGAGAAGTSYSGGTGGGGGYNNATGGAGVINGGAGGYGAGNAVYTWSCGGGAGNPGGTGANGGAAGGAGTGGLLIIKAYDVINNGTISSNGTAGGGAYRTGGGGSGGGSVNVFYVNNITIGTMTATGGTGGIASRSGEDSNGGNGGAGTVTRTKISN